MSESEGSIREALVEMCFLLLGGCLSLQPGTRDLLSATTMRQGCNGILAEWDCGQGLLDNEDRWRAPACKGHLTRQD